MKDKNKLLEQLTQHASLSFSFIVPKKEGGDQCRGLEDQLRTLQAAVRG